MELFTRADELTTAAKLWTKTADEIAKRTPVWIQLGSLLAHGKDLGPYAELRADKEAVLDQRGLLADPDPVRPILDRTVDLLRKALNARLQTYVETSKALQAQLAADPDWKKLTDSQQADLTAKHGISAFEVPDVSTPDRLQDALDDCSLEHWTSRTQALASRFDAARHAAAQLLKPNVVHVPLPRRTLNNAEELAAWLGEVESLLAEKIKQGPIAL